MELSGTLPSFDNLAGFFEYDGDPLLKNTPIKELIGADIRDIPYFSYESLGVVISEP